MSYTTQYDMMDEVRNGSHDGCSRFYRTYAPLIRMHGRDCGVPEEELDDLVQNVMSGFFHEGNFSYNASRGRFRAYLRQIIRARSMDLLRRLYRERRKSEVYLHEDEYLDRRYDEEWLEYARAEAMRRLRYRVGPERYQQFCMLALQNRDVKSVARFFQVAPATIYASFNRPRGIVTEIIREIDAAGE